MDGIIGWYYRDYPVFDLCFLNFSCFLKCRRDLSQCNTRLILSLAVRPRVHKKRKLNCANSNLVITNSPLYRTQNHFPWICSSVVYYFSPEFSNLAWCQFSITFNLGEAWIIYVCDLGIVILLSGMLINVRCCIDWSTRKIILTLGRCENILYLTILNDIVFVKRCLTLTLSALRF